MANTSYTGCRPALIAQLDITVQSRPTHQSCAHLVLIKIRLPRLCARHVILVITAFLDNLLVKYAHRDISARTHGQYLSNVSPAHILPEAQQHALNAQMVTFVSSKKRHQLQLIPSVLMVSTVIIQPMQLATPYFTMMLVMLESINHLEDKLQVHLAKVAALGTIASRVQRAQDHVPPDPIAPQSQNPMLPIPATLVTI